MKALRILSYIWAAPVTVLPFLLVLVLWALRQVEPVGVVGGVWEWVTRKDRWFERWFWSRKVDGAYQVKWAGWTLGGGLVMYHRSYLTNGTTRLHEHTHVRQILRLGIFQPILYVAIALAIYVACPNASPYFDNPFEIEARRSADQPVDIPWQQRDPDRWIWF